MSETSLGWRSLNNKNKKHGEEMMMVLGVYDQNGVEEDISIGIK